MITFELTENAKFRYFDRKHKLNKNKSDEVKTHTVPMKKPAAREFLTHIGYDSIRRNMHIDECTSPHVGTQRNPTWTQNRRKTTWKIFCLFLVPNDTRSLLHFKISKIHSTTVENRLTIKFFPYKNTFLVSLYKMIRVEHKHPT